jgi:nitroreductase
VGKRSSLPSTGSCTRRQLVHAAVAGLCLPRSARAADAANSFAAVVRRRAMIRKFTAKPVAEETVERLLRYATRAPSAGHSRPWEFIVVRDPAVRAGLAKAAQGQQSIVTAPVVIVPCANLTRAQKTTGGRAAFFGIVDTSFATLLILLGAVEQDLGACFVATYDGAEVVKILGIPDDARALALVPIGYPAEKPRKPPPGPKLPLSTLVHRDRW